MKPRRGGSEFLKWSPCASHVHSATPLGKFWRHQEAPVMEMSMETVKEMCMEMCMETCMEMCMEIYMENAHDPNRSILAHEMCESGKHGKSENILGSKFHYPHGAFFHKLFLRIFWWGATAYLRFCSAARVGVGEAMKQLKASPRSS